MHMEGNNTLRLLSINIECDKHYDVVLALIAERNPDVLCLQEVPREFAERLGVECGYEWEFKLRAHVPSRIIPDMMLAEGMLVAWKPKLTLRGVTVHTYRKKEERPISEEPIGPNDVDRSLVVTTLDHQGQIFRMGTTHFTWTHDGGPSEEQHRDMDRLLDALTEFHDETGILFCGDFNAPRGGEIFARLNERYTDNIPPHITSTIDPKLHRAAGLEWVVDGLFSTAHYQVHNVEILEGISDHKAIFAVIGQSVR